MTMDVATCIDPEIAAALAVSPMGSIDFGTFTFESLPQMRQAMAEHAGRRAAADDDGVARGGGARCDGSRPDRARVLAADEGERPTVRLLDPRRWLPVRLRAQPATRASTAGSRSSTASRCRSTTGSRPSTRTRRRSTTATPACVWAARTPTSSASTPTRIAIAGASAGGGLAAGLAIRARDRGEVAAVVPAPDLSDDRRPQHVGVEPHPGRAGVEPRRERPRVEGLPGRARRQRLHPGLGGCPAGSTTLPGSHPRGSASGRSTCSATRTSSTHRASSPRASRPSSTCTRARRTASR